MGSFLAAALICSSVVTAELFSHGKMQVAWSSPKLSSTGPSFHKSSSINDCIPSTFQAVLPSNATVVQAVLVPENGSFGDGPWNLEFPGYAISLPELCAVEVKVPSSPTTSYRFGLFLPSSWNQRYLATGNGGFGGGINWPGIGTFTRYGFAVMSTDTGHNSSTIDATWAINNTESVIDWGYRALHGSVVLSKKLVDAYYSQSHRYAYYSGCSTGGRQGLKEVQEFPEDFDGVLAGAPAWWTNHLQAWHVQVGSYNLPQDAPYHIPADLVAGRVADEILKQCDPQDGVVDNIISSPYTCNFDFEALLCSPGEDPATCLTTEQLGTLYQLYSDWVDVNQTFVAPALPFGSEPESLVSFGVTTEPTPLGTSWIGAFLYNDANWDWHNFSYATVQYADEVNAGNATAHNYDISPFQAKGGKLLHYHGYADGFIPAGASIYLYKKILQTLKPKGLTSLDDFYRFFLVPGMQHCTRSTHDAPWMFGAIGQLLDETGYSVPHFEDPDHDALLALVRWVEEGIAPESIIATKFANDKSTGHVVRQRPICPYPKVAKYDGKGNVDEASSWYCAGLY